jgi:HemY protein
VIRLILWFLAIAVLALVAVWLADNPGNVEIQFQAFNIETSFAALILMATAGAIVVAVTVWLVGWIRRDMPIWGSNQVIKRQRRGFKMMNQSLVALSAGDHKLALQLVQQAEVLLPPQPLVHLIAAEAAGRTGDFTAAKKRYEALEKSDDGRLLGLRGLLADARRAGHENEALRLARVAFEENRKSPWVLKTLFGLEVAAGNWSEADTALNKVAKENLIDKEQVVRHRGALQYAEATQMVLAGDKPSARKMFKKTLDHRPGFAPAVVALVRLEQSLGNTRQASKLIIEAWGHSPHASLAAAYKELDATEAAEDWLKRVRILIEAKPDHPQSRLVLVDAMMDAGHYDAVRPLLETLLKQAPSLTAWQYRLALAHVQGDDPDPIETALAHASDGAHWYCSDCGHVPKGWSPLCPECSTFDSLEWREATDVIAPRKTFQADNTISLITDTSHAG